ncbi:DUF3995 domain-containing protein [Gottfriedia endophytica]|uniref:DUF3995 domain-containing protein n=1 Tax=Gottfriedia endophytica TaxID=2820819 RepID=UPI001FD7705B|nr:DUF3995 domain-containing protein [Gottfriedia endophytica]
MSFLLRFTKTSVWPAYVGFLMALYYAVFVRFYEAANFTLSKDPEGFNIASYIAGVVIMICGFILLALVKPYTKVVPANIPLIGGKQIPRLIILIPTLFCTAFLLAHAISGIITKALYLCGAITIYFPHIKGDLHNMALWDLLFYEPWFLIMGHLGQLNGCTLCPIDRRFASHIQTGNGHLFDPGCYPYDAFYTVHNSQLSSFRSGFIQSI